MRTQVASAPAAHRLRSLLALGLTLALLGPAVLPLRADSVTLACTYDALNRLTQVTYSNGTVISYTYDAAGNRTAAVTQVPAAPTISTQPTDQLAASGGTATFTAAATGFPVPTLQWQLSTNGGGVWADVATGSGATTGSYTTAILAYAEDGTRYRLKATNIAGSAFSSGAILTVTPPAPAVAGFTPTSGPPGTPVVITGSNFYGVTAVQFNGVACAGVSTDSPAQITATVPVGATTGAVSVTTPGGTSVSPGSFTVTAGVAPQITVPPANQAARVGLTSTFTVTATGDPAPSYQWQRSNDQGGNWANVASGTGGSTASYTTAVLVPADYGALFRVIVQNGIGTATSTTAALKVLVPHQDFNGDGRSDLLWTNLGTGEWVAWFMNGTSRTGLGSMTFLPPVWQLIGSGDLDGDGKCDLLWRNTSTGQVVPWLMNGATRTASGNLGYVAMSAGWETLGLGDFDGDGKADLLWRNATSGQVVIWFLNGLTLKSSSSVVVLPQTWQIVTSGDLDGDGKTDLVWRNTTTNEVVVWLMNGATRTSSVSFGPLPVAWQVQGTADFDGDGKADLLWREANTGQVVVWFMNGAARTSLTSVVVLPQVWQIVATGDYNGDGKADLLWRNTATGEVVVWLMNGTTYTSVGSQGNYTDAWQVVDDRRNAPIITVQPSNQPVTVPAPAIFGVTATGTQPISYQWQRSNDGGTTWADVSAGSGGTTASYTTAATVAGDNSAKFRAKVRNTSGAALTSTVTLTIAGPNEVRDPEGAPRITSFTVMPPDITAGQGSTLSFVFTNGRGTLDQGVGEVISGDSIAVSPDATTVYTLSVTNDAGVTVTAAVTVTVGPVADGGQSEGIRQPANLPPRRE